MGTDTGIAELIDRVLQKGVILNADLVITVADIPLLAANLRLALASAETMLNYGVMQDLLVSKQLKTENNGQIITKAVEQAVELPPISAPENDAESE